MPAEKKLTLRLRPGVDDDLLEWVNNLRLPHGRKGAAIKAALRRGIGTPDATSAAQPDAGNLLADIRQVVEATLSTQLANLSLIANTPVVTAEEDEYANACLDQLGDALIFDVDDEGEAGWGSP